jgi:hypothetical protein
MVICLTQAKHARIKMVMIVLSGLPKMNLATECYLLMSKEYSWRDGWAYTYPHPVAKPPKPLYQEDVFRCGCSGNYVAINRKCFVCGQTMEGKK